MPPLAAASAALLVAPASPAPRPRLWPSRRARPAAVRAAALRALPRRLELWPQRLGAVESTPPPSSASPAPDSSSGLGAGSGGGGGGGDGGGGADLGWLRVFPHVLTASMANFLFGYHIGVMNGPIEDIARELGFQGNPFLQGLVVSIFIVGAFFGSLGSSALVDKFGCKRTLQIDSIPLIIGALLSAQADSLDEMLLGRFLVGIGIGVNTVLVPLYISEVAPTKYRGFLGTLCQIGTCLGIIAALSLGIPSESDPHWWRTMLYAACVPGFLIGAGMQFAVESPRWLAKRAFGNLLKLISPWKRSKLLLQMMIHSPAGQNFWWSLTIEFAGINGVLYFSSLTFRDVGITSGALASLYVGITNFGGALVASNLMDKQGRKNLLIGSYLGMAFAMFLVVYGISFPLDEGVAHSLSITGTLFYRYHYTRAEQCSYTVKSYGLQLHCTLVYAGFGGVSLLTALFAYNFIVETKGRSLEEIEMSMSPATPGKRE
ncbi:hypothetical protein SEVIR_2G204200v4 [Setaria viridis]